MAFVTAAAAVVGTVGAAYSADQQREAAKEQARKADEASRLAAAQASESARANLLAAQTASDREKATAQAAANAELAADQTAAPTVELATAGTGEAMRRRTVRASFNPNDDGSGSIRV